MSRISAIPISPHQLHLTWLSGPGALPCIHPSSHQAWYALQKTRQDLLNPSSSLELQFSSPQKSPAESTPNFGLIASCAREKQAKAAVGQSQCFSSTAPLQQHSSRLKANTLTCAMLGLCVLQQWFSHRPLSAWTLVEVFTIVYCAVWISGLGILTGCLGD